MLSAELRWHTNEQVQWPGVTFVKFGWITEYQTINLHLYIYILLPHQRGSSTQRVSVLISFENCHRTQRVTVWIRHIQWSWDGKSMLVHSWLTVCHADPTFRHRPMFLSDQLWDIRLYALVYCCLGIVDECSTLTQHSVNVLRLLLHTNTSILRQTTKEIQHNKPYW